MLITILSVALVGALAMATLYYGASAYTKSMAEAQAAKLINQGNQLLGAADMYFAQKGMYPSSLQEMVDTDFLKSIPVASREGDGAGMSNAFADEGEWSIAPGKALFTHDSAATRETCVSFNQKVPPGHAGILKQAYVELNSQCFGESGSYTVLVKRSEATTFENAPLNVAALATVPLSAALGDPEAWDMEPEADEAQAPDDEPAAEDSIVIAAIARAPGASFSTPMNVSGSSTAGFVANFLDPGSAFLSVRNISPEPVTVAVQGATVDGSYFRTAEDYFALGQTAEQVESLFTSTGAEPCRASTQLAPNEACAILASITQGPPGTAYPVATVGTTSLQMGFTPDWMPLVASKMWASITRNIYVASGDGNWGVGSGSASTMGALPVTNGSIKTFTQTQHSFVEMMENSSAVLLVKADGSLWGRGNNVYGGLGTGNTNAVSTLTQLSINGVNKVYVDGFRTYVIKSDGTLWGSGTGTGAGRTSANNNWFHRPLPESVVDGAIWNSGIFARAANGNLYYRGTVYYPETPSGTQYDTNTPFMTGVAKVASLGRHALILKTDGTVLSAGYNEYGQLGIGSKVEYRFDFQPVFSGASDVFATSRQSFVIGNDGRLYAAGSPGINTTSSALGLGDREEALSFTLVPGLDNVVSIASTEQTTLALRRDGTVWRTGAGTYLLRSYYGNTTFFVPAYF
ncbi:hypothetical protein [Hydrogenophaga sp. BPS33]|uniref:hypothetical protein n=1 Tax=Hydrogenophaga sp. BPS33 TaxID=2651974 RepID=UPI00131FAE4A|nr:hypothetical protein [Hydrogenophaga sp. BPS33]QHE87187.1 hypothetical protein F9K07_20925 [Hydrogenophaga sp. BPS33]